MHKLKPCLCGGVPKFSPYYGAITVICTKCGAKTKGRGRRKTDPDDVDLYAVVAKSWNRMMENEATHKGPGDPAGG